MGNFIKLYIATLTVFFGIDIVWLSLMSKPFYSKYLGFLMRSTPNWIPAIIFYLLYIVGILVFAVFPALSKNNIVNAVILGGFFGLCAYATYDLSNYATIKNWPLQVVIVDILWGITITAVVSLLSFLIGKFIIKI